MRTLFVEARFKLRARRLPSAYPRTRRHESVTAGYHGSLFNKSKPRLIAYGCAGTPASAGGFNSTTATRTMTCRRRRQGDNGMMILVGIDGTGIGDDARYAVEFQASNVVRAIKSWRNGLTYYQRGPTDSGWQTKFLSIRAGNYVKNMHASSLPMARWVCF